MQSLAAVGRVTFHAQVCSISAQLFAFDRQSLLAASQLVQSLAQDDTLTWSHFDAIDVHKVWHSAEPEDCGLTEQPERNNPNKRNNTAYKLVLNIIVFKIEYSVNSLHFTYFRPNWQKAP